MVYALIARPGPHVEKDAYIGLDVERKDDNGQGSV